MRQHYLPFIILFFYLQINGSAQSVEYSQPYTNLLNTNPAFAGTNTCPRFYLNNRMKNYSYDQTYTTYFGSYDQSIRRWNVDIGAIVERDESGSNLFTTNAIHPIISKPVRTFKNGILKLGFQLDLFQQTLSSSNSTYPDMIDPNYGFIYQTEEPEAKYSTIGLGASAGLLYYSNSLFTGITIHNILAPKTENSSTHTHFPRSLSAHIGYQYDVTNGSFNKNNIKIMPALYIKSESRYSLIQPGISLKLQRFIVGAYGRISAFRSFDSLSPMIGFHQKRFKFAYTCDFYIVEHKKKEFDTHEISLTIYLPCGKYSPKLQSIGCPGL